MSQLFAKTSTFRLGKKRGSENDTKLLRSECADFFFIGSILGIAGYIAYVDFGMMSISIFMLNAALCVKAYFLRFRLEILGLSLIPARNTIVVQTTSYEYSYEVVGIRGNLPHAVDVKVKTKCSKSFALKEWRKISKQLITIKADRFESERDWRLFLVQLTRFR